MRQIEAETVLRFDASAQDDEVAVVSVGPTRDPVWLSHDGTAWRIHHHRGNGVRTVVLRDAPPRLSHVQPLGRDEYVVAWGRARNEHDANAHVYDAQGNRLRSFYAGDAIEDLYVTTEPAIWIGYFDQGVLAAAPMSRGGVACLDTIGSPQLAFSDLLTREFHPPPRIIACYALNPVSKREVWVCTYPDFPLVRLVDRRVREVYRGGAVRHSHAFAVHRRRVLFAEQFRVGAPPGKRHVGLVDLDADRRETLAVVSPELDPFEYEAAFGRGSELYLVALNRLCVVSLERLTTG